MVFPVLILIHWGMGRFCFPFLANLDLIRKVLRADMIKLNLILKTLEIYKLFKVLVQVLIIMFYIILVSVISV